MSIAKCLSCQESVRLPTDCSIAAIVRCPLCREEYKVSEILATLPPLLEVIDDKPLHESESTEKSMETSRQLELAGVATAGEGTVESNWEFLKGLEGRSRSGVVAVPSESQDVEAPRQSPQFNSVEITQALAADLTKHRKADADRRKQASTLVEIIKVILGGVVAVPSTLLLLLWLPGAWRDPLRMGHQVARYAPWIVPGEFSRASIVSDESESEKEKREKLKAKRRKSATETAPKSSSPDGEPTPQDSETMEQDKPKDSEPTPEPSEEDLSFLDALQGDKNGKTSDFGPKEVIDGLPYNKALTDNDPLNGGLAQVGVLVERKPNEKDHSSEISEPDSTKGTARAETAISESVIRQINDALTAYEAEDRNDTKARKQSAIRVYDAITDLIKIRASEGMESHLRGQKFFAEVSKTKPFLSKLLSAVAVRNIQRKPTGPTPISFGGAVTQVAVENNSNTVEVRWDSDVLIVAKVRLPENVKLQPKNKVLVIGELAPIPSTPPGPSETLTVAVDASQHMIEVTAEQ